MEDITTCRVINKNDDSLITIFTEWLENDIKITIFSSGSNSQPLVGEMKSSDIEIFAKNLSKTRDAYIEATRLALSGRDSAVDFVLKESKLRWKRGAWNHGMVEVAAVPLVQLFLSVLDRLLARHEVLENLLDGLKAENEELKVSRNRLEDKTEEMIKIKNELEADLYRRFVVVLNSKKAKIRELDEQLKQRNGTKGEDPFDAMTDDSEDSESEKNGVIKESNINSHKEEKLKRQIGDSDRRTSEHGEDETEENRNKRKKQRQETTRKSSEDVEGAKASTSGKIGTESISRLGDRKLARKDFDVPVKNESLINFTSEDSEDDLFA